MKSRFPDFKLLSGQVPSARHPVGENEYLNAKREGRGRGPDDVSLRDVTEGDLEAFFEHQRESDANDMAAFPARDRDAHMAHWRRILDDITVATKTILCRGEVVGNVVSWEHEGKRNIGYWIGRAYWGWGIATEALCQFLDLVTQRPLYAFVAKHNAGRSES